MDIELINLLEDAGLNFDTDNKPNSSLHSKTPVRAKGWLKAYVTQLIREREAEIAAEKRRQYEGDYVGECFSCGARNVQLIENLDGLWMCECCFLFVDDDKLPL